MLTQLINKWAVPVKRRVVVHVRKPGTLAACILPLFKYQITHLVVEGQINGSDLAYLREMAGSNAEGMETKGKLSVLDLSRASFVSGGSPYYHRNHMKGGKIGKYAFYRCYRLTRVILPADTTSIGEGAFGYCISLKNIIIPDLVRRIGTLAFFRCESLTSITLGRRVVAIGDSAFLNCTELKRFIISDAKVALRLDDKMFQNCPLEKLYIGRNIEYAESPFEKNRALKEVAFGKMVTCIGESIFTKCHKLADLYVLNATPPCAEDSFNSRSRGITLHVPALARRAYEQCAPWNSFRSIVAIF